MRTKKTASDRSNETYYRVSDGKGGPSNFPPVEWAPVESLRPNPKNARTHSKKQIRQIAQSICTLGFLNPVIVDDQNMILAGHGRFEAARLVGLAHVPILRFSHLTEAQKRAYAISDNRIAEQAGWDRQLLSVELGELADLLPTKGFDISLTGFKTSEIDILIAPRAKPRSAVEEVAPRPPRNPISRPGDLWLLGGHRLLCGDAQNADDFGRLMDGAFAVAVFCAPPSALAESAVRRGMTPLGSTSDSVEVSPEQYRGFLSKMLGNAARVSSKGGIHFVCIDWRRVGDLMEVGRKLYDEMLNLVVWNKTNASPGSPYRSQHELIGVFRLGREPRQDNTELRHFGRNRSDVWTYPAPRTVGKNRAAAPAAGPAHIPVALVADALLDCAAKGEVVLDPVAGSGATIIATEKVARVAYGLEREARFVDVAIQRWQRITNREATLAGDGRSFATIVESRASPEVAPSQLKAVGDAKSLAITTP
jgi:DNA modification methylase